MHNTWPASIRKQHTSMNESMSTFSFLRFGLERAPEILIAQDCSTSFATGSPPYRRWSEFVVSTCVQSKMYSWSRHHTHNPQRRLIFLKIDVWYLDITSEAPICGSKGYRSFFIAWILTTKSLFSKKFSKPKYLSYSTKIFKSTRCSSRVQHASQLSSLNPDTSPGIMRREWVVS